MPDYYIDTLATHSDIMDVIDMMKTFMSRENRDHVVILVKQVYNPISMIEEGFLPYVNPEEVDTTINSIRSYYYKYTVAERNFWCPELNDDFYGLSKFSPITWIYATIGYWKKVAEEMAYSLPLLIFGSESLLYPSRRPRTDMLSFKNPKRGQQQMLKYKIPVTRYGSGMSKGLYHDNNNGQNFCGTFYYMEPDSNVFLMCNNPLRTLNKYTAFKHLQKYMTDTDTVMTHLINDEDLFTDKEILFLSGTSTKLPHDLMMSPKELEIYDPHSFHTIPFVINPPDDIHDDYDEYQPELYKLEKEAYIKRYAGTHLGFYAIEDIYDQAICILGARAGYDVIILERMVGSYQVVTEILDTRDRSQSFDNLLFL